MTTRILRSFAAAATLVLAAACSDTIVTPTFGAACEAGGSLRAGDVVLAALHEKSCRMEYNFYSGYSTPYASYSVHLEQGKAYFFTEEGVPDEAREGRNGLDALLMLYARNNGVSTPVAVSDDQGFAANSEMFFIAPKTGDYQLIATSYDGMDETDSFGGYRLSMQECPVIGRSTGADTLDVTLVTSSCTRSEAGSVAPFVRAPADYRFISIKVAPHEQVGVRVTASGYIPAWEIFGAGMDVYGNLDRAQYSQWQQSGEAIITTGDEGGYVTLAIGSLGPAPLTPQARIAIRRIQN